MSVSSYYVPVGDSSEPFNIQADLPVLVSNVEKTGEEQSSADPALVNLIQSNASATPQPVAKIEPIGVCPALHSRDFLTEPTSSQS